MKTNGLLVKKVLNKKISKYVVLFIDGLQDYNDI